MRTEKSMKDKRYDVIIVGGSYAGLAAAMALGRALQKVLVIDEGKPCNAPTPYSHNFLTNDGRPPAEIASVAKDQVMKYPGVQFNIGKVIGATQEPDGFEVEVLSGEKFHAEKLVFATGIRDILPDIEGLQVCWGKSVLHCPFCHGYEVRGKRTGVLLNNEKIVEFVKMIANWSKDLTLFTNGKANLSTNQRSILLGKGIKVIEKRIEEVKQESGQINEISFSDGTCYSLEVLYAPSPFEQHSALPAELGCAMTADGYIQIDEQYETTVKGIYAIGDNASRMRTVANAVAMGTMAGMGLVKKLVEEGFGVGEMG